MDNKKINIGLFIDTWFPMVDGVINVVDNYAKRLSKIANVTVFAPRVDKNYDISKFPYKIVLCKSSKFLNLDYRLPLPKLDRNFKKEIKNAKLDIIHIHSPFSIGKMAVNYGRKHKIPVIATFHSQFERDFYRATKSKFLTKILLKIIIKTFNNCNLLLTMNSLCADIVKSYGYKGKIKLLPNGTDLQPEINLLKEKEEIIKKFSLKNEHIFINIGRLVKQKNIDLVIDTCKILKERSFNFKLFILGGGQDENYFKNKVKNLKLNNEIIFLGKIYDNKIKASFLSIAELNIFPSFYDTDGIVKIEAAAFETPTLFAKGSVASSSCKDNINGFIAEANKISFANKIIEIFNNKENYLTVSKKAKEDLYVSWDNIVKELRNIYKEIKND